MCLTNLRQEALRDRHGSFDFGVRQPHCYSGAGDSNGPARMTIPQRFLPEMVKHMEDTAPKGADLSSWKY